MGIALEDNLINSIDERTGQYFPTWSGSERENITIRNLMTLTTGLSADCIGPPNDYTDGGNSIYYRMGYFHDGSEIRFITRNSGGSGANGYFRYSADLTEYY